MFEAKTIQRMELLVLSSLQWKMHPVTPLSFLNHIIRRLGLKTHLHWEFLRRCECLLLSVVSGKQIHNSTFKTHEKVWMFRWKQTEYRKHLQKSRHFIFCSLDSTFIGYPPSVLATATMMRVIDQVEPSNAIDYKSQLLGVLKLSKVR